MKLVKSICLLMFCISPVLSLESSKVSLYFETFSLSSDLLSLTASDFFGVKASKASTYFLP